jgi:hypothetical protein
MDTVKTFIAWSRNAEEIRGATIVSVTDVAIKHALGELKRRCKYIRKQAETLLSKVQNTRALVRGIHDFTMIR